MSNLIEVDRNPGLDGLTADILAGFQDPPSFLSVNDADEVPARDPRDTSIPFNVEVRGDRVLVRRDASAAKIGSIHIAQTARERPMRGTVVAVGTGKWNAARGDYDPLMYEVGDRVLISRYAGNEFKFDVETDKSEYTLLREDEVLMVLHDLESEPNGESDQST